MDQSFPPMDSWDEWSHYITHFRLESAPGATWEVAFGASFFYVILVYGLQALLQSSPRFEMKGLSIVHNFNMFTISIAVFLGAAYGAYVAYDTAPNGMDDLFCDPQLFQPKIGVLRFWLYVFWASKIYEFLDTVIIVLRKSPLIFLHVYHHWITNILAFHSIVFNIPTAWTACIWNSFVHIPMYLYYLLSVLGYKDVWFKRYITQIQITQFVCVISMHSYSFYLHYVEKKECSSFDAWWKNVFGMAVIVSYLALFIRFYLQSYNAAAAAAGKGKALSKTE